MTQNKYVLNWIKEMSDLVNPDKTVWIDGSDEQADALRQRLRRQVQTSPKPRAAMRPNLLMQVTAL